MVKDWTWIRVERQTRIDLAMISQHGESCNEIIKKLIFSWCFVDKNADEAV